MSMPPFLNRLIRPFTQSTRLSLTQDSGMASSFPEGAQKATVAAGCFWGVEHLYRKHFGNGKGLLDARVGYTGGATDKPNYRGVCSGRTGREFSLSLTPLSAAVKGGVAIQWLIRHISHTDAESLQITFDPTILTYRQILEFFYRMHDPTTLNRQGADVGTQYRSAIFWHDEEQEKVAKEVTAQAEKQWWKKPITTEVAKIGEWYDAETYHQQYLDENPGGYECPMHYVRKFGDLE
jgi:peptide-methionine (S)-S-oxide reductase